MIRPTADAPFRVGRCESVTYEATSLVGLLVGTKKKRPERRLFLDYVAEQAGFEPAEGY